MNENGKLAVDSDKEADLIITTKDGVSFGDADGNITIDFSKLTQYANDMDAKPHADGNSSGKIEGYAIDDKGGSCRGCLPMVKERL